MRKRRSLNCFAIIFLCLIGGLQAMEDEIDCSTQSLYGFVEEEDDDSKPNEETQNKTGSVTSQNIDVLRFAIDFVYPKDTDEVIKDLKAKSDQKEEVSLKIKILETFKNEKDMRMVDFSSNEEKKEAFEKDLDELSKKLQSSAVKHYAIIKKFEEQIDEAGRKSFIDFCKNSPEKDNPYSLEMKPYLTYSKWIALNDYVNESVKEIETLNKTWPGKEQCIDLRSFFGVLEKVMKIPNVLGKNVKEMMLDGEERPKTFALETKYGLLDNCAEGYLKMQESLKKKFDEDFMNNGDLSEEEVMKNFPDTKKMAEDVNNILKQLSLGKNDDSASKSAFLQTGLKFVKEYISADKHEASAYLQTGLNLVKEYIAADKRAADKRAAADKSQTKFSFLKSIKPSAVPYLVSIGLLSAALIFASLLLVPKIRNLFFKCLCCCKNKPEVNQSNV